VAHRLIGRISPTLEPTFGADSSRLRWALADSIFCSGPIFAA
jgi:hypothetical protein